MSLADLYNEMTSVDDDIEKYAGIDAVEELIDEINGGGYVEDETVKIAEEYDAAGRIMARSYLDEILKFAADAEEGEDETDKESEEDKKRRLAEEAKKKGVPPQVLAAMAEKKAEFKQQMIEDPEYAQAMFDWYNNI